MELEQFFENMLFRSDGFYNKFVTTKILDLGPWIIQYGGDEKVLLKCFQVGEYSQLLDSLCDLMMKELRSRVNHLGIEAFNMGNGFGYTIKSEGELDNLTGNKDLIAIAYNMGALLPSQEMELLSTLNLIEMLKKKINGKLSYLQRKELSEVVGSVISFYDSPRLEKWGKAECLLFLIFNTDMDDLEPIIEDRIKKLDEEELGLVTEKIFFKYITGDYTICQGDVFESCFIIIWSMLPYETLSGLTEKIDIKLNDGTEDELVLAITLLRKVYGIDYFSENNVVKLMESYYKDQVVDDLLQNPCITNDMIMDLRNYGVQYLTEDYYDMAAEVFLDFYIKYAGYLWEEDDESYAEAVDFIPELLETCGPELLDCFIFQIQKLEVQDFEKYCRYRDGVLKNLIGVIDRRRGGIG